ncbi:MAG: preprotein translocase subunit SecY [Actinomycetota bacterium]
MLKAILNAFKVPELRNKILFTLAIIALYRFGAFVPSPGVDHAAARRLTESSDNVVLLLNLFSGGALTQLAVFGLGIMPYITASIMMQLLTVVIPKLEEWRKEGEAGTKKITQTTRYVTIALAVLQSTGITVMAHSGGFSDGSGQPVDLIPNFTVPRVALIVLTLTAGTAMVMWLGEQISQRGVGNGMSIIIFASIISAMPVQGQLLQSQMGWAGFSFLMLIVGSLVVGIVFIEQGQRRVPVQYAKRMVGRKMYGGGSTYIPLKINQSGIIPIIFASSVLYFPLLVLTVVHWEPLRRFIENHLGNQASPVHILFYGLLVVGFSYFYTAIAFNPVDVADNMKKYGGFIPGIRPGRATAEHLSFILNRITLPGALFIASIAIMPGIVLATMGVESTALFGTSILIAVGVSLETMKQVESQLLMRHYEGFLS